MVSRFSKPGRRSSAVAAAISLLFLLAFASSAMAGEPTSCETPAGEFDNCETCYMESSNPWCGESTDPFTEISCSPFQYRPMSYNNANGQLDAMCNYGGPEGYKDSLLSLVAYDDAKPEDMFPYPGTRVWAGSFTGDCSQGGGNSDYWVFHACDGAGIQGGACAGDINYVERFGPTYTGGDREDAGICTPDGQGYGYDNRKYCKFVHPGTETVYDSYKAGWAGNTESQDTFWAKAGYPSANGSWQSKTSGSWDENSNLVQQLNGLPSLYNGDHPFAYTGYWFSFPMFSWRAYPSGTSNNYLSYPSIADPGWKLFVDNEPCGDDGCYGAPPEVDLVLGGLAWDQQDGPPHLIFEIWRSDIDGNLRKLNDETNGGKPYELYPVHPGDGSCAPW